MGMLMSSFVATILITDSDVIRYYVKKPISDAYLVLIGEQKYIFTDKRYFDGITCNQNETKILYESFNDVVSLLKERNLTEIGLIYEYTSLYDYNLLINNDFKVFDYTSEYNKISSVKNSEEISLIKKSCEVCQKSFYQTIKHIKAGITELELSAILEYYFKKNGATSTSFESIVAFGEGSAIPHYKTSNIVLKKDMPILMDFGCIVDGFASDMTRSLYFGNPTDKFVKVYNSVLKAHNKAIDGITHGISGIKADSFARNSLKLDGYGEYFTHSLGHGVGVKVHESPRLSPKGEATLVNGNVFTIEPGVYLNGEFGIRIEDTFYLENGKCKSFMTDSKELLTLKA